MYAPVEYLVTFRPEPRPPAFQDLEGENEILGKLFPQRRVVLWPQWIWKETRQFSRFVPLLVRTLLSERFCLAAAEESGQDHPWCQMYRYHVCPPENVARMGMSLGRKVSLAKPSY